MDWDTLDALELAQDDRADLEAMIDTLVDDLERRAAALSDAAREASTRGDVREVCRLRGKVQGIRLAISVIEDRQRGEGG